MPGGPEGRLCNLCRTLFASGAPNARDPGRLPGTGLAALRMDWCILADRVLDQSPLSDHGLGDQGLGQTRELQGVALLVGGHHGHGCDGAGASI